MGPRPKSVAALFPMRTPATIRGGSEELPEPPPMGAMAINSRKEMGVARRLKLHAVRIKDFRKHQDIGRLLGNAGATECARGMYLMNQAATERALDAMQELMRSPEVKADPDRAMSMIGVMVDLLKHHGSMAERIDKSGSKESPSSGGIGSSTQPSLPPSHANIGVMVTLNGSTSKASDVRTETTILRSSGNHRPAQIAG